jgi:hypothetical protein
VNVYIRPTHVRPYAGDTVQTDRGLGNHPIIQELEQLPCLSLSKAARPRRPISL